VAGSPGKSARDVLLEQAASDARELSALKKDINQRLSESFVPIVPLQLQQRERDLRANPERVKRDLAALDDQDVAALQAAEIADRRFAHERAEFWFRRFFTSLGVGNGAAFAAISAGLLQAQKPEEIAPLAFGPLVVFAVGTVTAGLVPFVLYLQSAAASGVLAPTPRAEAVARAIGRQGVFLLTALSVLALLVGVSIALGGVHALALRDTRPTQPVARSWALEFGRPVTK